MKKQFKTLTISLILLGLSVEKDVLGQDFISRETKGKPAFNLSALSDRVSSPSEELSPNSMASLERKLFKKFMNYFPEAKDAVWYRDGKQTYFYFHGDGTFVRTALKENGEILHIIRYYYADRLPASISSEIREKYRGYKLEGVTEVRVRDKTAYIVNIKGMEDWLQVKYLDGTITEYAEFRY